MKTSFWLKLKNKRVPILALAPMAGFTDSAFRQICKKYGADVLYSEMASVAALYHNPKKQQQTTAELLKFYRGREKYYVVQLFGSDPEQFAVAAQFISQYIKPDGIDINFGCPVPKIIKQGAGSGLMQDLVKSRAVLESVLANTDLPVSIKIRAAAGKISAEDFLQNITDLPIAAVMIHGRTLKQGFVGQPDLDIIKRARKYFKGVLLINGGINNLAEAQRSLKLSGADGLGLARGVLGRPWMFKEIKQKKVITLTPKQIFKIAFQQATLEIKEKGKPGIIEMRKHLAWYAQGLTGASKLRSSLVKVSSLRELKNIISSL